MSSTLLIFENDLRLHDNGALIEAVESEQSLICLFCVNPTWFKPNTYGLKRMGHQRHCFLEESLSELHSSLALRGQSLNIAYADPLEVIPILIKKYDINTVIKGYHPGYYENSQWQYLQKECPGISFKLVHTRTLFTQAQLDYKDSFPGTFSKFKRQINNNIPLTIKPLPSTLPPPIKIDLPKKKPSRNKAPDHSLFRGGEKNALSHVTKYFSTDYASSYKKTRNSLEGWSSSCKFSPWLANGNLSVKRLLLNLIRYEEQAGENDSTEWIYFELLWREYFQWYAHNHGKHLFFFKGISQKRPLTTFYPQRFKQWCMGQTPWPIINACMNELNETGYMSNRGRQLVASCLIYELELDWRCGAAYFEQQLVDYDMASNWGNWQYIAGVGADPCGGRHFNLEKQSNRYDPDGNFTQRWQREPPQPIDFFDAADWPLENNE